MTNLQQYAAEIIVNNETGETFMSQSALARVCDVGESTIRAWKNSSQKRETKEAEVLTTQGLRTSQLFSEVDIAAAITKYNPHLAAQLMLLGVRSLLHELSGWKAQPVVKALSERDHMELAIKALTERLQQDRFCDDKPGLRNIIKFASAEYKALGSAKDSLADICRLHFDVDLDHGQLSSLGRYVAGEYKSWYRLDPIKELVDVDGQMRRVAVYSSVMYPTIENWLRHEGHIA